MHFEFQGLLFKQRRIGPWTEVTVRGDGLYDGRHPVAHYRNGFWELDGEYFVSAHSGDRVCLRHAETTRVAAPVRPLTHLKLVDGSIFGDQRLLWTWTPPGRWLSATGRAVAEAIVIHDC
jgi:hypothetical protein